MAKLVQKSRAPSRRWIGRRLTACQRLSVPVLSGADDSVAEVLDGQELEVIEVQSDGWLRCKLRQDMFFKGDGLRVHSKDLIVGVHSEHDLAKFQVLARSRLRESARSSIIVAAQEWLTAKSKLDELSQSLTHVAHVAPEIGAPVLGQLRELFHQRTRVDRAILALQQRVVLHGEPEWFPEAVELLMRVSQDIISRAARLSQEVTRFTGRGPFEQRELVQVYSWSTSFLRRLKTWLRRLETRVTELEGLVFYS